MDWVFRETEKKICCQRQILIESQLITLSDFDFLYTGRVLIMNERKTLIEFLCNASDYDLWVLFQVLDVAHQNLIYESTDENLVMDQFMTSLWIAARSTSI